MPEVEKIKVQKIDDYRWRIPREGKMKTDGIIYADQKMLEDIQKDMSLVQVANVACLPGIVGHSLAMPDIHWGYGFPIGGVAAFDPAEGVVSPGGVGYDINCGVRLMRSNLRKDEIQADVRNLIEAIYRNIPSGVGSRRKDLKLGPSDEREVLIKGAAWAIGQGFGVPEDLEHIEDHGCIAGANPDLLSKKALDRGRPEIGTVGSGNHFVEISYVTEIFDEEAASVMRLDPGTVTVMIHSGSRGLGHQVCEDNLNIMLDASRKYGIELPDRQLACAPVRSQEGQNYLAAMACAANFAFTNRQLMTHWVRQSFQQVLDRSKEDIGLGLIYDVCHNIAKIEEFDDQKAQGRKRKLCVHRKGATRAFPAHHPLVPRDYQSIGQPVLIPGDMGRYSFVLLGTEKAMTDTFGSTCHGAGRLMSRHQAMKVAKGRAIIREMEDRGILVRSPGKRTVVEEISEAYKDVADVIRVAHGAGISRKVAKLVPLAVLKG
ncbi:MAG: RtcB family protein [bacterium]